MYVYAAGPIAGLHYDDAVDWRRELSKMLMHDEHVIEVLSPMRAKQYLKGATISTNPYEFALSTDNAITGRDRFHVQRCDVMVCNLLGATEKSIGTCIELGWADAWRKPVILIMEDDDLHDHPMVRSIAAVTVSTLEHAAEIVKAFVLPSGGVGW